MRPAPTVHCRDCDSKGKIVQPRAFLRKKTGEMESQMVPTRCDTCKGLGKFIPKSEIPT